MTGPTHQPAPKTDEPSVWKWALSFASAVGLTGVLCCVAPMVLFMLGLMSGIYAISFTKIFYNEDGSSGPGAWLLRIGAAVIAVIGIALYRRKQNQCSVDPKRKRRNLVIVTVTVILVGVGFYFTLYELSSWYFEKYISPAQQEEYRRMEGAESGP